MGFVWLGPPRPLCYILYTCYLIYLAYFYLYICLHIAHPIIARKFSMKLMALERLWSFVCGVCGLGLGLATELLYPLYSLYPVCAWMVRRL